MALSRKSQLNDRNMPAQHITILLGATCCVRLATLLRRVETCWVLLAQIWPVSNLSQQHPTCCNTSQHGGQMHATRCAQQCCDMLRWHVAIVWPGLYDLNCRSQKHKWNNKPIEGLRAKRAYIAFLANFHFLQDRANFWQNDLFWHEKHRSVIVSVDLRFVLQK